MSGHVNNFGYVVARDKPGFVPMGEVSNPGGVDPLTAINPAAAQTRGQKVIKVAQAREQAARYAVGQPEPPLPPKAKWRQTRLQAPAELAVTRSRMDLLSEKIANG